MPQNGGFALLDSRGSAGLDRILVRLAAILSFLAGLSFFAAGILSGDPRWIAGMAGPLVVTATALWQLIRHQENLVMLLVVSGVATVVQNRLLDVEALAQASAIVLAFIGIIGAFFVRRHAVLYVIGYATLMFISRLWWSSSTAEPAIRLVIAVVATVSVVFGSTVMIWLRNQLDSIASRHAALFEHAPVPLWEEDFSAVGDWVDELRSDGVEDMDTYLAEHPQDLINIATMITITSVNEAAADLMGVTSRDELLGPLVMASESVAPSMIPQIKAIWNNEDRAFVELEGARSRDGRVIEALLYWSAPRVDGTLDLRRVTVAVVDITTQRETERQLHDLIRSKDEFVATVSHELRTPLTAVVGLAEELRDNRFSEDERRELVALVAEQGLEVSKIVEDLLVAARAEAGTLDVAADHLDLDQEIAAVLRTQGLAAVPVIAPNSVPPVYGDGGRVRQIVRNLITNSQRNGGQRVRVVVVDRGDYIDLEVRDTGDALPERSREAIFEPYYRARQTPGVTASVGLGLTVSRDLARRMGGDLTYDHDGAETIFTLSLRRVTTDEPALPVAGNR